MKRVWLIIVLFVPTVGLSATVNDDFSDGVRGPQWSLLQDDLSPSPALSIGEENGHLDVLSSGGGLSTNDSGYLSTFRISTASDFVMTLDYFITPLNSFNGSATSTSGDKLGLDFGVGRDLDGTDSAAIGVGYGNVFGIVGDASTIAYRIDDVQTTGNTELFSPTSGTFEIDYTAGTDVIPDELTFKRQGSSFVYALPAGTVRGTWGAEDLLVSLGGRGSGFSATAGQMYVDNFTLVSGTVVPEPACLTAFGSVCLLVLRRRRRS